MDADIDRWLAAEARIRRVVLRAAVERLHAATDNVIAETVATPPDAWGMTLGERIALARYLASRRDSLLAMAAWI